MKSEEHQIITPWHEVPVEQLSGRTHMGQLAKLARSNGWEVRLAKTIVRTIKKTSDKTEDIYWLGGAMPNFDKPTSVFLYNKFYASFNMEPCDYAHLKRVVCNS